MIRFSNLTISHAPDKRLLAGASANIPAGSLCALIGRNGSGKSTLLRTLAGLSRPESGNILIADTDPYKTSPVKLAQTIAVVTTERIRVANLRCRDVVALGRAPFTNWIGRMRQDDIKWVDHALGLVGMAEFADRQLSSLSDGESQRIMLARALAQDTPVILLDEPTSFLDIPNRIQLINLLADLAHNHGKCILFSTHELDLAISSSDSLLLIDSAGIIHLPAPQMEDYLHANAIFS